MNVALTGLAALPQNHGPRWIAVGDAAAKLDPLGSAGTATALDSGQRTANAIRALDRAARGIKVSPNLTVESLRRSA